MRNEVSGVLDLSLKASIYRGEAGKGLRKEKENQMMTGKEHGNAAWEIEGGNFDMCFFASW